jgi:hypothetical protein
MQAAVREIFYCTVDKITFLQIKNEADADVVTSIHANKGSLYEANLWSNFRTLATTKKKA